MMVLCIVMIYNSTFNVSYNRSKQYAHRLGLKQKCSLIITYHQNQRPPPQRYQKRKMFTTPGRKPRSQYRLRIHGSEPMAGASHASSL